MISDREAYETGFEDWFVGIALTACPYTAETDLAREWEAGWLAAEAANSERV